MKGMSRWVWGSMPPGITYWPDASITRLPSGAFEEGAIKRGRGAVGRQAERCSPAVHTGMYGIQYVLWSGQGCSQQVGAHLSMCHDGTANPLRTHAHLHVWLHSFDQSIADEYVCLELLVMIDNHATLRIIRGGHGEEGGVWQQLMSSGEGFWGRLAACVHRGSTAALAVQESLSGVQWLAWLGRKAVHMQRPVCQHGQHE